MIRIAHIVLGCLLVAVSFTGCGGSGDGRRAVIGTVTLDGTPMASGSISFQPAASGTGAGGGIIDGKFAFPDTSGLMPGEYRVTINSFRETGRKVKDPQRGEVPEMKPVTFLEKLPLSANVAAEGENKFDFSLTSRPK